MMNKSERLPSKMPMQKMTLSMFLHPFTTASITQIAVVMLASMSAAAIAAPINPHNYKQPIRVACVGDSITAGIGAENGKSYPSQLQYLLGDKWEVKNFGLSGRTLLKKGDNPYWVEAAFKEAQAFKPDVVIIMLGTNDTKPQNWVHKEEFAADYKQMVETFLALESKPRVFVCHPCPVPGGHESGINETNVKIEIEQIDRLAQDLKLGVIDMHGALESNPEYLPDHVHPNTAGAGVMAATAYQALTGKASEPPVTMESLKPYTVPEWFEDAKLGMWGHWGPQGSTDIPYPIDCGWYARFMYQPGNPVYEWHVKNLGHPSVFGYKDILKRWNPSKFDAAQADRLVKLYKQAGAKFFVALGAHHDNFDMWDSKYQPRWNAKAITGKDIVGLWHDAAKKNGLRFGVSSHVARSYRWFQPSHGEDAGGKYDGQDPAYQDLYGVPWPASSSTDYEQTSDAGPIAFEKLFENRMKDLLDKYHPDLYYTDGGIPFKQAGLNILSYFYKQNKVWNGSPEAVATIKLDYQESNAVMDYEGGSSSTMAKYPFMSDKTTNAFWWWSKGEASHYRKANEVIDYLVDLVSKNGVLCLNIPLKPDGSIEPESESMLKEMGQCLDVIGEAIFKTRVWTVYGEGPTHLTDFGVGTATDIRFTRNKANTVLYATVLDWPGNGATLTIKTLNSGQFDVDTIKSISMLGTSGTLSWKQDTEGLKVILPSVAPASLYAYALKIALKSDLAVAVVRPPVAMVNDNDPGVTYTGHGWNYQGNRSNGEYNTDIHETPTDGDSFSYPFIGTGIELITITASNRGDVDIYIDNVLQPTVSCKSDADHYQQTVFSKTGLPLGRHTIKGVKKSGQYLTIDAFKVLNSHVIQAAHTP
jgi:alpha-L-fucosidase